MIEINQSHMIFRAGEVSTVECQQCLTIRPGNRCDHPVVDVRFGSSLPTNYSLQNATVFHGCTIVADQPLTEQGRNLLKSRLALGRSFRCAGRGHTQS